MRIGVPSETLPGEHRVAATPETVKKLAAMGHTILLQSGAGRGASIPDSEYAAVNAEIVPDATALFRRAEILLKVRGPSKDELKHIPSQTILIGVLEPNKPEHVDAYVNHQLTAFSLELLPRITRAQSMDVLSSQANVAGYKAVLLAANAYSRFFPMLMTAAGTVRAARTLILGAGVAGLQAIATARRLGAIVEAFDVRPSVKEQVESLGAVFIDVPDVENESAETAGGYAMEMSTEYRRKQNELIHNHAIRADIVISSAMIPGKPAPVLIPEATVWSMKPGSVIVDMAVSAGGNCALSEYDKVIAQDGVTIIGWSNIPSMVAAEASSLYARNLFHFLGVLFDAKTGAFTINRDDEIVAATLLAMNGEKIYGGE